jgi:predicted short-subunit dehydrogenase-like oxidoreductase (DUF2520 family)
VKADAPRFAVVVDKRPGTVVVFSSGLNRAAAELLVAQLAKVGCAARVTSAVEGDRPGMERRPVFRAGAR